jgi:hypothetical protein
MTFPVLFVFREIKLYRKDEQMRVLQG